MGPPSVTKIYAALPMIFCVFPHQIFEMENIHGAVLLLVKLKNVIFSKVAGFSRQLKLKLTLLHGCFSRCLNCTNSTKLRKASHFGPFFRFRGVLLIFTRKKVEILFFFFSTRSNVYKLPLSFRLTQFNCKLYLSEMKKKRR